MANEQSFCGATSIGGSGKPRICAQVSRSGIRAFQCARCCRDDRIKRERLESSRYQFLRAACFNPKLEAMLEKYYNAQETENATAADVDALFDSAMQDAMNAGLTW